METIEFKKLMVLENILLIIDKWLKFELDLNDAYKLKRYINEIGDITNYFFELQTELSSKANDNEKLKEYHDMLISSTVEYNHSNVENFIDQLLEKKNHDYDFFVDKYVYWR